MAPRKKTTTRKAPAKRRPKATAKRKAPAKRKSRASAPKGVVPPPGGDDGEDGNERYRQYYASKGSRVSKQQLRDLGPLVESVGTQHLKAEDMVRIARNPKHPAHKHFEWNDKVAGKEYRKTQARHYICSIKIKIVNVTEPVRTTVSLQTPQGPVYHHINDVRENANLARMMAEDSLRDLRVWHRRFRAHLEALGMDNITASIEADIALMEERLKSVS